MSLEQTRIATRAAQLPMSIAIVGFVAEVLILHMDFLEISREHCQAGPEAIGVVGYFMDSSGANVLKHVFATGIIEGGDKLLEMNGMGSLVLER